MTHFHQLAIRAVVAYRMLEKSASVVLLLTLVGCASFGGIGSQAKLATTDALQSSATLPDQAGKWPSTDWAREFGGAQLQSLVDEALENNPGLRGAAARVASAQAVTALTRAAALPGYSANFSATRQRYTENGIIPPPLGGTYETDSQVTLNFRYDFDFWGKNGAALRSALSQGKASQAEQYQTRLVLTTAVARTWLQLARNHAQLDMVKRQLTIRDALDKLTRQRFKAGLDSQSDNQLSLQQAAGLRAEQAQWLEAIALSRNQLAALLGKGPDRGLKIERPTLPAEATAELPGALPLELIGRRPDIVAARWRVESTLGQIDYAKTLFYPNIDLIGFAGLSSLGLSNLLLSGSRIVGIGPAIRLPIFSGNTLRAQLRTEVAGYDAAVASYNQALTEALRDVADQVQSLKTSEIQATHQKQATSAATQSLKLAAQKRRVGTYNQLQLLTSEASLVVQQRIEFDVQARRLDLRIALIKALGGGFDSSDLAGTTPGHLPASGNSSTYNLKNESAS
jgi:NodT family efflux transporter outer membrane factor (OMF) lipoprotein